MSNDNFAKPAPVDDTWQTPPVETNAGTGVKPRFVEYSEAHGETLREGGPPATAPGTAAEELARQMRNERRTRHDAITQEDLDRYLGR